MPARTVQSDAVGICRISSAARSAVSCCLSAAASVHHRWLVAVFRLVRAEDGDLCCHSAVAWAPAVRLTEQSDRVVRMLAYHRRMSRFPDHRPLLVMGDPSARASQGGHEDNVQSRLQYSAGGGALNASRRCSFKTSSIRPCLIAVSRVGSTVLPDPRFSLVARSLSRVSAPIARSPSSVAVAAAVPMVLRGRTRQSVAVESCSDLKHWARKLDAGQVLITTRGAWPHPTMRRNPASKALLTIGVARVCGRTRQWSRNAAVAAVGGGVGGAWVRWAVRWQARTRRKGRDSRGRTRNVW